MGGGNNFSAQEQKLFVGGLPPSVTPASFRQFFEQYGPLLNCTCMMDRETGKPRGFGFLTYQDDSSLQALLSTHPIVFDGKEVDVKRAQSKNDPQSLQMRRQQRMDNPDPMNMGMNMGMGGRNMQNNNNRYGMGTGSNNFATGNTGWGGMNPMMMAMGGGQGFDQNAMAQMYQNMAGGFGGGGNNWNPQMAWQQMMANMAGGNAGGAGGMDMGAMMGSMGMGMGMMGAGMGNMSPPTMGGNAMSPTMGNASARGGSSGPSGDEEQKPPPTGPAATRYQRGGSHMNAGGGRGGMQGGGGGSRDERERSPSHRRERSPNRRDGNGRYDGGARNRY